MTLLNRFFSSEASQENREPDSNAPAREPRYELLEKADAYSLRLFVPGVARESLELSSDQGVLTVKASQKPLNPDLGRALYRESEAGPYQFRLRHEERVRVDAITAEYADGVLTVTLPKPESARLRQIPIA